MNSINHISLLHKRLSGLSLSDEEQSRLAQWLEASEENQKLSAEIEVIWNSSTGIYENYEPNKNSGWGSVLAKIDASEVVPKDNIRKLSPRFNILRIAAVFVLLLGLGVIFTWMNKSSELMLAATGMNEQKELTLSDGSTVILNKLSSIEYPEAFSSDSREVVLTGEAFFDITKNPDAPFNIETSNSNVTVLGTSFNVRAYKKEAITEVAVMTGKVKFSNKASKKAVILSKHQAGFLNHSKNSFTSVTGNTALNELSWRTNKMTFRNTTLFNVKKALENHFGIELAIQNKALLACPFSANFDLNEQSLRDILKAIKVVFQVEEIKSEANIYEVIGGNCN